MTEEERKRREQDAADYAAAQKNRKANDHRRPDYTTKPTPRRV